MARKAKVTTYVSEPWPTKRSHPKLRNATKKDGPFDLVVTNQHSIGAVSGDPCNCAAARAACALPEIDTAWVGKKRTVFKFKDGRELRYENSKAVSNGVEIFDGQTGLFPPGLYRFLPIPPSAEQAYQRRRDRERKGRPRIKPYRPRKTNKTRITFA